MADREVRRSLTRSVAVQVRRHREKLGWSAQEVADRCAQNGLPISRSAIANLENGRRDSVRVDELIVLGLVLDAAPLDLLFPPDQEDVLVEYLPDDYCPPRQCARHFAGSIGGVFLGQVRAAVDRLVALTEVQEAR